MKPIDGNSQYTLVIVVLCLGILLLCAGSACFFMGQVEYMKGAHAAILDAIVRMPEPQQEQAWRSVHAGLDLIRKAAVFIGIGTLWLIFAVILRGTWLKR